jgi:REP element-mobilizing transposase RayT
VYKWFNYLRNKHNIKTTAYEIMPDHLHCILFFPTNDFSLNKIISNAKRFMAYEIIKRLKATNQKEILDQLQNAITAIHCEKVATCSTLTVHCLLFTHHS